MNKKKVVESIENTDAAAAAESLCRHMYDDAKGTKERKKKNERKISDICTFNKYVS